MILEIIGPVIAGGIVAYSTFQKSGGLSDASKIQKIAANCGLTVKEDGKTKNMHLLRRTRYEWGVEYAYRIPLGLSFADFEKKKDHFQDGLNNKKMVLDISLKDLKQLKFGNNLILDIKQLFKHKKLLRKEIELSYDGLLKIRVYNEPLTDEFMYTQEMIDQCKEWEIPIGLDRRGKLIKHDFEIYPHLALGGATRYGKSNFLNSMIISLIKNNPHNVKFHLIDLKGGVELGDYEHLNQTISIAYEPEDALFTLEKAYYEMLKVQEDLRRKGKKKVQDTDIKTRHFVIVDEVGELNPEEAADKKDIREKGELVYKSEKTIKEECQIYMSKIARLGAGLGFRQILATQYPTGDVIPRACKQSSDAKLSFRVRNATASKVVLDEEGAEQLPRVRGRAIYVTDQKHIVQTPFISEQEINKTIQPYIYIQPRKERDETNGKTSSKGEQDRIYTPIFEEVKLP